MRVSETYFGVDIYGQLAGWWHETYLPAFHEKYGPNAEILVDIYDTRYMLDWDGMEPGSRYRLHTQNPDTNLTGEEGLVENIQRKFRASVRHGEDSAIFEDRPDLLEPGDFPYKGAGYYRNYYGGASGLPGGDLDWTVFTEVVDQLIIFRTAAAQRAVDACKAELPGWKYLQGLDGLAGLPPIPALG